MAELARRTTSPTNQIARAFRTENANRNVHLHAVGSRCVSAHFDAESARVLADKLRRLRKLEKQVGTNRGPSE